MPLINNVSSVEELPDQLTLQMNSNSIWEFRIKGMLLGQFVSQEQGLGYFNDNCEKLENQIGIDLSPKVIKAPKTILSKLKSWMKS